MLQFIWSGFRSLRQLSPDEAAELAARVTELTKAGLPLGPGLRALADEMTGRRMRRTLHAMADRLDAGDDLLTVLEMQGRELPEQLRGLMVAGVRSGRLPELLEEYIEMQHTRAELYRRVLMTLAYPFVLLLFVTALAFFAGVCVVPPFAAIYKDFGTALPGMTVLIIKGSLSGAWLLAALVGLLVAVPVALWISPAVGWVWVVLYRLPMVGPLLRWSHLSQFSRLMAMLLEQHVALPDALQITAAGLLDANLARGCRDAAEDAEKGLPLDESLSARRQFPASMIPLVQWGLRGPALPDAFRGAAEMFEGRVRTQGTLLDTMLLPILLLLIATISGFYIVALFLPLIALISKLSG